MKDEVRGTIFKLILPKVCRLRPEVDIMGAQQAQLLADEILSIHALAVVDREAKLPESPNPQDYQSSAGDLYDAYNNALQDMVKAGWVKEVK